MFDCLLCSIVPHSLLRPEDGVELCVIVKDPAAAFKDKLAGNPVPGFTKVIGVDKLRRKYGQYKERMALVASYDAFFVDKRVARMMPQLLGKIFYDRKKQPAPVDISGNNWARELGYARDATYMHVGWGQTTSIRVGRVSMSAEAITANVMAAIGPAVAHIPKKWRGLQAVSIQAPGSVALPVFKSLPGLTVDEEIDSDAELEFAPAPGSSKKASAGDDDGDDSAGMSDLDALLNDYEDEDDSDADAGEAGRKLAAGKKQKQQVKGGAKGSKQASASSSSSAAAAAPVAGSKRPRAEAAAPSSSSSSAAAPAAKKQKHAPATVAAEPVVSSSSFSAAAAPASATTATGGKEGAKKAKPASLLSRKGLADQKAAAAPAPAPAAAAAAEKKKKSGGESATSQKKEKEKKPASAAVSAPAAAAAAAPKGKAAAGGVSKGKKA